MGNMNTSRALGSDNVLGIVDSRYPWRILDCWGDVNKSLFDEEWRAGDFTVTATGTSPITNSVLPGAIALITTAATDYAGDNIQEVGSKFSFAAGKPLYFGAKLTINDATLPDLLVGLCGVDTTLTAASAAHAIDVSAGGAFFSKLTTVTAAHFKVYTTNAQAATAPALTMDTNAHIYEIVWDGYTLFAYIDGALVATIASGVTTEVLTPSLCFRAGSAAAKTCTLHWMKCFQARS